MLTTAAKLIALLDRRERVRLALLFGAVLVMAFLQMGSIAAVLPFLSVAADPALIHDSPWLAWAYATLGFTSTNGFLSDSALRRSWCSSCPTPGWRRRNGRFTASRAAAPMRSA